MGQRTWILDQPQGQLGVRSTHNRSTESTSKQAPDSSLETAIRREATCLSSKEEGCNLRCVNVNSCFFFRPTSQFTQYRVINQVKTNLLLTLDWKLHSVASPY